MRSAALNTGSDIHLLDHIAPLAELLQIPLIATEELNFSLASQFYPQIEIRFVPDLEFRLKEMADEFDLLFECKYWQPHLKTLFKTLFNKEMRLVFCPHGQSDKGYRTPLLAPYSSQDRVLIYGPLMIEMLKELQIPIPPYALIGNYRLDFYKKHRSFYDRLAENEIQLDRSKRTLLYAPTWSDADGATSFFRWVPKLVSELPADWNLIIKLHPLLEQRNPAEFFSLSSLWGKKGNLFLIDSFPPVYPILSLADAYLGDASSVGYDFLSFQRPLFFFPAPFQGKLHTCGKTIDPAQNLYRQLESPSSDPDLQTALYKKAFSGKEEHIFEQLFGNNGKNLNPR